ncbi:MAG: cardiolipin synthase B [Rudaea sp.]|uniref:phospholipase D-like domain-containing protein n=1 Tax=unclassified Rudaea TaxID=2627037 RepID=UPI0010F77C94|nr:MULTISPECIES: phospholipase D-like domain-containing protein [unclassified Rudaea]MBN8888198.1 cardiolipin synthase B [Rudaea sp.]
MSSQPDHPTPPLASARNLTAHAFERATGAELSAGNDVELLIDAQANFDHWLAAIRAARQTILLENYIVADDSVGREFRAALAERAAAGVRVAVIRDWLGCLGNSKAAFWQPLLDAGGEVRAYNPPRFDSPLGWLGRDHRKLLVVDGAIAFVSGICVAQKWLGDPPRGIAPWRDTGVAIRGPACADVARAFVDNWAQIGAPLALDIVEPARAGDVDLRVIATTPNRASLYRTDLFVASMARRTLWLTDAYFVGFAPYVQALCAAARDGVDVRLLVPGTSNLKLVARLSHAGYRPLLEAGVKVYEWNGSMIHAKTAVADGRWARVGSSNLNVASWLTNCEIDVAVENEGFAQKMAAQYEQDLLNATEVVLDERARPSRTRPAARRTRGGSGSSSRAAAGTLRLVNTVGAAIGDRRVLGSGEAALLPPIAFVLIALAVIASIWPRLVAWPLAVIALWVGASLLWRWRKLRRKRRER